MSRTNINEKRGRIEVHTPEIMQEIFAGDSLHRDIYQEQANRLYRRSVSAPPIPRKQTSLPTYLQPEEPLSTLSANSLRHCRIKSWLDSDSLENIQKRSSLESRSVRNLYRSVLDNEKLLADNVKGYLEHIDEANNNKKAELFKKWTERVYIPMQEAIKSEMNSSHYKVYKEKKRQLYDQYIDYRNKKGIAFLDVISPNEYDPTWLNCIRPGPLKARVGNLHRNDPLLHQDYRSFVEQQDITRCRAGQYVNIRDLKNSLEPCDSLLPCQRQHTTCQTWLRMPIHDIDSPIRAKNRQRITNGPLHSQTSFRYWQYSSSNSKVVDVELHSQKKRLFPQKYRRRAILEWPTSDMTKSRPISTERNCNLLTVASE